MTMTALTIVEAVMVFIRKQKSPQRHLVLRGFCFYIAQRIIPPNALLGQACLYYDLSILQYYSRQEN